MIRKWFRKIVFSRLNEVRSKSEKGQGLVEMALSITFLILILSGVMEFGRLFYSYMALTEAAQEGASYGSIAPTDTTGIEAHVRSTSSFPIDLTSTSDVTVTVTTIGSACAGNVIQVRVTYDFPIVAPFIGAIVGGQTISLSATAYNTILTPSCP
jgi:Flp pilus assembly protein TadG